MCFWIVYWIRKMIKIEKFKFFLLYMFEKIEKVKEGFFECDSCLLYDVWYVWLMEVG